MPVLGWISGILAALILVFLCYLVAAVGDGDMVSAGMCFMSGLWFLAACLLSPGEKSKSPKVHG